MALDSRSKVRLGWVAAAAAPIVAVQAARLLSGGDPGLASAAVPPMVAAPVAIVEPVPQQVVTPEQQRALDWLTARRLEQAAVRSPIEVTVARVADAPRPSAVEEEVPLPKLRLGGIASRGKNVVASINNRLFAVGDEPAEGWTITEIDAEARAVALDGLDERKIVLTSAGVALRPAEK